GRPPFLGETPVDTAMQVQTEEPVPPSRLLPKLPRDLDTICLKCLEKEPHRRYASAVALADDLARFLSNRPIQARPLGRLERTWRGGRRNPVTAGLLAALLLVVTGGLAGLTALWLRAEANHQEAERQREQAQASFRQNFEDVDQYFIQVSESRLL